MNIWYVFQKIKIKRDAPGIRPKLFIGWVECFVIKCIVCSNVIPNGREQIHIRFVENISQDY